MESVQPRQASSATFTLEQFRQQAPRELNTNEYLQRQAARESNARSYPRRIPLALQEAHGLYVRDTQGQLFMDCLAGAGTLALGHNHPVAIEAMRQTLDSGLPLHTLDLTTPVKDRFVEDLFAALPENFARHARIQFCGPTGADGIEAALKLARIATGRKPIMSFSGGYHGMTLGTLSLMGNLGPKQALGSLMADVQFLPYPYDYRCPFGIGGEAGIDAGLHFIEQFLGDPESGVLPPAAIVVEVVQGEGGVIPAPVRWLQGLRQLTRKHGVALIIDEVQTGIGRTGKLFAFEHAGIEPDILVLSKAIGGGLPLSVVVYREELDTWKPGSHAGTFRGNQMAMAAGAATLRHIISENLPRHADVMGQRLMSSLRQLQSDYPCLGQVRGRGLMVGVEIVSDTPGDSRVPAADTALAQAIQRQCLHLGVILELGGRHGAVVRFLPPLIIQAEEIDVLVGVFQVALDKAIAEVKGRVLHSA
ncbi:diaminobutyrate--2-oxoglutarate transaminase [Pseudomonas cichorii]|uniref:2,4-diaminobutyrate 4-transaminase n=1 Tax=Pseudomonas cichorii TaxID=36746 RepID=A0A3M4VTL6_PSECI|nr:diaminobutyrate--2-oxoglutarate transaminase [Pseudomonas cichorii]AHF67740.1 2,4-diaminobutyrate 4-transaminase [Pseudomonas cichorii JBC1]QVE14837.1 diaminobutyrate--2-oxoglutarate transaminase [Pseudomonas cichorii]RMR55161.1 2,4-diaminobutyrate 4-transaminase [Pseudomonas cichorii]SDP11540.1 diaminobutyrate aminotransferase apoenzyme [Pseudomonas cichorii]GFM94627.1 diaminobutyrate--2-oxoglutarate aminotransferase [Pseudomonas cichorii]